MQHNYFIYITTNPDKTTFYCGVTNNLEARITEHYLARGQGSTFAGRYHCYHLLYYERYQYIQHAIDRETEIEKWSRKKKLELVMTTNASFRSLNYEVFTAWPPESGVEIRTKYN